MLLLDIEAFARVTAAIGAATSKRRRRQQLFGLTSSASPVE